VGLNEELFFKHLKDSADLMKIRERPTVFVHGFNNTFEDAVLRAAQIGHDLGIGQGIGLYSWPSKGKKRAYAADEAAVEESKYHLANFIETFVENSYEKSINLIAHSMGCRCLLNALEVLSIERRHILSEINQVILAAADVDAAAMRHLSQAALNHSTRTTSYVSDQDKALLVSEWLHDFPRVGVSPPTFVLDGMDTVIVNDMNLGDFSHGYVSSSRVILGDMHSLLKENRPPENRFSIEEYISGSIQCWRLKN
jgi:esterase/lipase superfamily enzyme